MTVSSRPRSIQALLYAAPPDIAATLDQVQRLRRIETTLANHLPAGTSDFFKVAGLTRHRLRLHAANGAWATRLRYSQAAITRALARELRLSVNELDVRVRPAEWMSKPAPSRPRALSPATRRHIQQTASYVSAAPLAAALRRLAESGAN